MRHSLKIADEYFDAVSNGIKTCELRREDDRRFGVGDTLVLRRTTNPADVCDVAVTHILRHDDFEGVPEGWALMSVKLVDH